MRSVWDMIHNDEDPSTSSARVAMDAHINRLLKYVGVPHRAGRPGRHHLLTAGIGENDAAVSRAG